MTVTAKVQPRLEAVTVCLEPAFAFVDGGLVCLENMSWIMLEADLTSHWFKQWLLQGHPFWNIEASFDGARLALG